MSSDASLSKKRPFSGPNEVIDDNNMLSDVLSSKKRLFSEPEPFDTDNIAVNTSAEVNQCPGNAEAALEQLKCPECEKKLSNHFNLKRHFFKAHPGKSFPEVQKVFKYSCDECSRNFNYVHHFKAHMRTMHGKENTKMLKLHKCFICSTEFEKKILFSHYETEHALEIHQQDLSFSSFNEFLLWKENFEKDTKSRYIVERGAKKNGNKIHHFYKCHRSGNFDSNSNGLRSLKLKGSKKINYLCPSSMKLIESMNGQCSLKLIETHFGHESELVYLQLTQSEKKKIAEKLAMKIPLDVILDDVRDSISKLERIHLLDKQDLRNIEKSFNLNCDIQKDSDDGLSVDIWVKQLEQSDDCILLYKPQGVILQDVPDLKSEDFVLIIMNEVQKEMLKKYGSDCICVDGTHGMNSYQFELFTLMVIDDIREGFPCAFFFCNRSDEGALSIFFKYIKSAVGSITANVFMSDMAIAFYNAWIKEMNPPKHFLYCTWHVDHAWRKNLNKIKDQENKVLAYKILRTILEELDEVSMQLMMKAAIDLLSNDTDTASFAVYFQQYYAGNVQRWAFCYRQHCGLNTNMHLERMHRTIKHIYLEGRVVKRLDKALHALMRFLRNRIVDRLIMIEKGKISTKLKYLRNRHRNSLEFDTTITKHGNGWNVLSETKKQVYLVEKSNKSCPPLCTLMCNECNVCIHKYICTCADSAIKWNMCKHIHKVCMLLKNESDSTNESDNSTCTILQTSNACESSFLIEQLDKTDTSAEHLEEEINKIKTDYIQVFNSLNKRQLDFMKKNLLYVKATLPSLGETACTNSLLPETILDLPQKRTIDHQKRLYPTKKIHQNQKLNMMPSSDEKNNIAKSLMLKGQNSNINI